ncbi:MAG TPA: class I adenylate-forming enzyme family protein [Acidimicrobiia bacterium]|nr:class I adenylate-forming enzyme family protein [Acidimicrobiia bacterium]
MSEIKAALEQLIAPGGEYAVEVEDIGGFPTRTFVDRPRHLSEFVALGERHGDADFLIQAERRLSHAEVFGRARRLAGGLRERFGIAPGDRLAVLGANHPDWVVGFWAGALLDAVVVPLNAWWTPAELSFALSDAGISVVLADSRRAQAVLEAGHPADRIVVWGGSPPPGVSFDALVAAGPILSSAGVRRPEGEPAVLFYTSGTTGRPKGAPLTHRNVATGFLNSVAMTAAARIATGEDRQAGKQVDLTVVPLFHATANLALMVPFVAGGHAMVFLPPGRFDPEVAGEVIERERVTRFGGVPTIVARVLESGVWRRRDFSTVRRISYGGAPASPDLVQRVAEAFPGLEKRLIQGYGLTETTAISTLNIGPDYLKRPDSVGIAAPTAEIRIVDPFGDPLPPGETGEIAIRGAHVMPAYWNRPDADAAAFRSGFFHTGDLGHLDEEGFLYVTDRAKDVVIRGGENVYSVEVEEAIETHEAVIEAAVVGVPDSDLGERVKAFVVTRSRVTTAELAAHLGGRIADFKVPEEWDIRSDPLPRNPSGKVLKRALREGSAAARPGDSAL